MENHPSDADSKADLASRPQLRGEVAASYFPEVEYSEGQVVRRSSLSSLVHRLETREELRRRRVISEKLRIESEACNRVLGALAARADLIDAQMAELRRVLAQRLANEEYDLAQEALSTLLFNLPHDLELQQAQAFLDSRYERIGELRAISVNSPVKTLAASRDDRGALVGRDDRIVSWIDLETGTVKKNFPQLSASLVNVALLPGEERFVAGCHDGKITVGFVETGAAECWREYGSVVLRYVVLRDGSRLAAGGNDGRVRLFCFQQNNWVEPTFESQAGAILALDGSPDSELLLIGGKANKLVLWSVAEGRVVRTMTFVQGEIRCVRFFPGGRFAMSGHLDGSLRVWDTQTGREMGRWDGHVGGALSALTPDGRHAITGGEDKTVRVWDVVSGREVRALAGHGSQALCVAAAPDGKRALSGGNDGTLRIWGLGV